MRFNTLVSNRNIVEENNMWHNFGGIKLKSILFWFLLLLLGNTFVSYMIYLYQIKTEENENISWVPFNIGEFKLYINTQHLGIVFCLYYNIILLLLVVSEKM